MSFSDKYASFYKRVLPSPFSIAILLTLITFLIALVFTKPSHIGFGTYSLKLMGDWESGLWKEGGGGLYFAFQMMFMLVLGHVLAISSFASKIIDKITIGCTNTANTAATITFYTIIVSLFNWGLGLIFGAILARKVGEKFRRNKQPLNYSLIGAAAYSGLMVWHGGLSGSAPIKASDDNNLHQLVEGIQSVDMSAIPNRIDPSLTLFSTMNIVVSVVLLTALPALIYWVGKKQNPTNNLPRTIQKKQEEITVEGAEKIDHSRIIASLLGGVILIYAFYKAIILPEEINLAFLNPNFINLCLFGLAILLHQSIYKFIQATGQAITGASGILIQFPLYFGILGIMVGSGLIGLISDWFVSISNATNFPIFTFFSAGLVNVFVPSGGGQWAVQGPIIISAAQELGVSYPKAIMALAYGDQLTNMIQPFWALPLLGITGLKAKEILPYTLILFLAGGLIFLLGLLLF